MQQAASLPIRLRRPAAALASRTFASSAKESLTKSLPVPVDRLPRGGDGCGRRIVAQALLPVLYAALPCMFARWLGSKERRTGWSACATGSAAVVFAKDADDAALNLYVIGGDDDGLDLGVRGLQADLARSFAIEALQRSLFVLH